MKKIDLGQTLGVLTNPAVVAGIVFLAIQIREERDYAIVETTTIVGHGMADWMSSVAHDRDRADIIFRGSQDFQGLTPLEQFEFDLLMRSWIMRIEMSRLAQGRNVSPQGSGAGGESTVLTGNLIRYFDSQGTRQWRISTITFLNRQQGILAANNRFRPIVAASQESLKLAGNSLSWPI